MKRFLSLFLTVMMVVNIMPLGAFAEDINTLPQAPVGEGTAQTEVTPEATPEVTPEATPEVTPEVTPEATPEVTPEATPEVTTEISLAVGATREIAPPVEGERYPVNFFVRKINALPANPAVGGGVDEYLPAGESHTVQGTVSKEVYNQIMSGGVVDQTGVFGNGSDKIKMDVPQDLAAAGVGAGQNVVWYFAHKIGNKTDIHIDGYIAGTAVSLEYNANFGIDNATVKKDTTTGKTETIIENKWQRLDYTFLGWNTDKDAKAADPEYAVGTEITMHDNTRLYAIWAKNPNPTYTVGHYTEQLDGSYELSGAKETLQDVGADKIATAKAKSISGFTAKNPMPTGTVVRDNSLELRVEYTRNEYTLKYVVGGEDVSSANYKFGAEITTEVPADPTKVGYVFAGWDAIAPTTMPSGNVTITAKFVEKAQIKFYFSDGTSMVQDDTAPDILGKTGDLFTLTKAEVEDKINAYLKASGRAATFKYESFVIWQGVDGIDNKVFDSKTSLGDTNNISLVAGDTAVHVSFEEAKAVEFKYYKVDDKGQAILIPTNSPVFSPKVFVGDDIKVIKGTAPAGYTYRDAMANGVTLADVFQYSAEIEAVNVYYAYDAEQWFGVTYEANVPAGYFPTGIAVVDTEKYLGNATVTIKNNTMGVRDGKYISHTFNGWSKNPNATVGDVRVNSGMNITTNTTLYAIWKLNEYTITFTDDKGDEIEVITAPHGTMPEPTVEPTKAATAEYTYTFAGWDKEIASATRAATYKAVFTKQANQYTVSYEYELPTGVSPSDSVQIPASSQVAYDSEFTIAQASNLTGFNFNGWTIKGEESDLIIGGSYQMPAKDVTFVATWTAAVGETEYTEVYLYEQLDGSYTSTTNIKSGTAGQVINGDKTPTSNGFAYNPNHSEAMSEITINADGKSTIKMHFDRKVSEVSYTYNDTAPAGAPEVPAAKSYKFGQEVTVDAAPTVEGYIFSGWAVPGQNDLIQDGKFNMGATAVTLEGEWTARTDLSYRVEEYEQNTTDDLYTLARDTSYEGIKMGMEVEFVPTAVEGFTYDSTISTVKEEVKPDGTTVLKIYYNRNSYPLNYYLNGTLYNEGTVRYGTTVVALAAPTVAGSTFNGWTAIPATMPANIVNIYGSTTVIPAPTPEPEPEEAPTPVPVPVVIGPVTPPTVIIPDPEVPEGPTPDVTPEPSPSPEAPVVIPDEDVPQGAGVTTQGWALVNLLLMIATALTSIVLLAGYFANKKKNEENGVYEDEATKKKGFFRIASLVPAIGAIVMFILTENMANPMVMMDKWTVMMLCIALVQVAVCFFSKKTNEKEEKLDA